MNKKAFLLLLLVIFAGAILRFWQLGKVPISPDWDEVALGYNAYSMMQTGRDEYGKFLPIVMRSFDDYKPALYSYIAIPSVAIFGLNVFAVRLPSAIFGILTIIAVYFLLRELFGKKGLKIEAKGFIFDIPIVGAFLLAISPWHIQFSRIAFESNIGLSFNIFAALFFIKGLKKPWLLSLSTVFAALSIYVYQSEKVFTPLFFLALVIIYSKGLLSKPKKYIISATIFGFILIIPMLFYTLGNSNALERAKGVSIFSGSTQLLAQDTKRLLLDSKNHDFLGLVLDNRRIMFTKEIISGYLSHFDFNWLFITGDISRHHAPSMGLLYLLELPFLLIGIYFLIFGPFDRKTKIFIFAWFLIVPIPASITTGVPHAVRTLNFLPTFQIFTAIGIVISVIFIKRFKYYPILFIIFIFIFGFNFLYFLDQYFIQQNYFNAKDWQYGYEKIVPKIQKISKNYKKIIVSNQAPMDQSYMFFLFYMKYSPKLYQTESINASGGFRENHSFSNFEFRPIKWREDQKLSNTLFIGRPDDFSGSVSSISSVNYPNGEGAMKLVEVK